MSNCDLYKIEDQIDQDFILRVQKEVTTSCALPFALPIDRIPEFILQAAQWFWLNDNSTLEERYYLIPNEKICKGNKFNKIVQLPPQIMNVYGAYRLQQSLRYGNMGDFSVERMIMSTYSLYGGLGGGVGSNSGLAMGYNLTDVVSTLYEVDTFNQTLNPPLTYNYNMHSCKLVLLGDLGYSDLLICCMKRCRIQDLYNHIYFFKAVVAYCKRALNNIYGIYEFKLPGGVQINYSKFKEDADEDLEEIKEWCEKTNVCDYFFMPNTL